MSLPVAASSAIRRQREFIRMRRSLPSVHMATPRWTKPVPLGGWPASYACGSYSQSSVPVWASSATTRLYDVLRYIVSLTTSGVTWNVPGRTPLSRIGVSPVAHSHAGTSWLTFSRVILAAAEYFVAPASLPYVGQSTRWAAAESAATADSNNTGTQTAPATDNSNRCLSVSGVRSCPRAAVVGRCSSVTVTSRFARPNAARAHRTSASRSHSWHSRTWARPRRTGSRGHGCGPNCR